MILTDAQIAALPAVRPLIETLPNPRHRADHALRAYQSRHLSDLARDLGLPVTPDSEWRIAAGCGILILRWHGNEFHPAEPRPPAPMLRATPSVEHERRVHCAACDRFDGTVCTVAGCRCNGLGDPTRRFGRCPLGRWHA